MACSRAGHLGDHFGNGEPFPLGSVAVKRYGRHDDKPDDDPYDPRSHHLDSRAVDYAGLDTSAWRLPGAHQ